MSKRKGLRTAAQAAHRRRRHAYRSEYNSPENKAKRAGKPAPAAAAKPVAAPKPAAAPAPASKPPQG